MNLSLPLAESRKFKAIPPPLKSTTARRWPRAALGLGARTIVSRTPPTPPPAPEEDDEQITEVAMAIAEQLASMTKATQPVAADAPLMLASLAPTQVVSLHSWLRDRYDWEDPNRMMFDEDVTAEDLAKDIVSRLIADPNGDEEEEEEDVEESFKTALEFVASPFVWVSDTAGNTRDVLAGSSRVNTRTENFPSIASLLSPSKNYETPLRSAPIPTAVSKYLSGEASLDIGMAPYESWTGKRSRKHSRASKAIFGILGLAALTSPISPTTRGLTPSRDPRAPSSAHTPIFSPWLETVRVHSVDPVASPWVPNLPGRGSSDSLWAFPQSPRCIRC